MKNIYQREFAKSAVKKIIYFVIYADMDFVSTAGKAKFKIPYL